MTEQLGEITACYSIRFNRTSKHSAGRLWSAITDPEEVSAWMDYPTTVDLRVGGGYLVDFSSTDDGAIHGVIVRVEPERNLAYVWGTSVVEWTIEAAADGCTYTFIQNGLADRGDDEEGLAAGWHEFLDRLEGHLEGEYLTRDEQKANWERLKPTYRKMLEAAIR